MEITSVSYSQLVNTGNYENRKIGCDMQLAPGDDPGDALEAAKQFVLAQHAAQDEAGRVAASVDRARVDLETIKREVRQARDRCGRVLHSLEHPTEDTDSDIPF
jgi:hypothetical protein